MPKLTINGQEIEAPAGSTILQVAQSLDIEVPVFCYHPRLKIAGNCRMCLVEVENSPKPVASCAMPVSEGMKVWTQSPMVEKARKGALEFLLINHPLDCPICDQGGECDLQDITMGYGSAQGRYDFKKRAVPGKSMGPLIQTFMNRCIHCTRCVRFSQDISGTHEMGAMGRGEHMEITTFLDQAVLSELSGNMVDICPVGALTSKPYAFQGRPWELTKTNSIDVMDALGSAIRIDSYQHKVMRILPRLNEDINEEWISDKSRYSCDGLSCQRIDRPYVRMQGALKPVSWNQGEEEFLRKIKSVSPHEIAFLGGDLIDTETVWLVKSLAQFLGAPHLDCRQYGESIDCTHRGGYVMNTPIAEVGFCDYLLMVGTHLRFDAPMIHSRFRKKFLEEDFPADYIGGPIPDHGKFTFPVDIHDGNPMILKEILQGNHQISQRLKNAHKPLLFLGQDALIGEGGAVMLRWAYDVCEKFSIMRDDWKGFNMIHRHGGRVGALDVGFVPGPGGMATKEILEHARSGKIKVLVLLGVDEISLEGLQDTYIVYQGHHGDQGANRADLIFPGAAYTEKNATFVNTEGRPQRTQESTPPPGEAQGDWKVWSRIGTSLGAWPEYERVDDVRAIWDECLPHLNAVGSIASNTWGPLGKEGNIESVSFQDPSKDFYMTNVISRYSKTMASCAMSLKESIQKEKAS